MSIIKLYGVGAAGVWASASADVPLDGYITTVALGVSITQNPALADAEAAIAELSFASTPQFTANDVRNSLCQASAVMAGGGAAAAIVGLPSVPFCVLTGLHVRIYAGEKIWLHGQLTATIGGASAVGYVYIEDNEDRGRARVRTRRG